jgi:hypothetical protein
MRAWPLVVVVGGCGVPTAPPALHLEPRPHRDEGKTLDRVRGVVQSGEDMFPMPVQFAVVELVHADRVVRTTNTDHDGRFVFDNDVPRGMYEVRLAGDYIGSTRIDWPGRASKELLIRAQRR